MHRLLFLLLLVLTEYGTADDDGIWTYNINGDETRLTGCISPCPENLVIPAKINGHTVSTISSGAFVGKRLTTVTIPDSVITIGHSAFMSNELTTVNIGGRVTTIGMFAFEGNQLISIAIPNSVTTINLMAFANNQLTDIKIPKNMSSIGWGAFGGNRIKGVFIPESVVNIGSIGKQTIAFDPWVLQVRDEKLEKELSGAVVCSDYMFAKQKQLHALAIAELMQSSVTHDDCMNLLTTISTLEIEKAKFELKKRNIPSLDRETNKLRKKMWKQHKNVWKIMHRKLKKIEKTGILPAQY
jgi:hypothetical protein